MMDQVLPHSKNIILEEVLIFNLLETFTGRPRGSGVSGKKIVLLKVSPG
jgi:hypothetical protein